MWKAGEESEETLNFTAFISDGIRPRKLPTYCKL
jgi:hypothetical protein